MTTFEVSTQRELDAALKKAGKFDIVACVGDGRFTAWGSSHVVARESSHVEAWGSSHVVAWGSSHVVARESSHVEARGSSHVEASKYVSVHKLCPRAVVRGGVIIEPPPIDSAAAWLDYYGVEVKRGIAVVYKSVDEDWHASNALPDGTMPDYSPGSKPEAPDFDPAPRDCGKGLHACARPSAALTYPSGSKFVAIPVRVKDMGAPAPGGDTCKIRFKCAAKPIYEVDIYGEVVNG